MMTIIISSSMIGKIGNSASLAFVASSIEPPTAISYPGGSEGGSSLTRARTSSFASYRGGVSSLLDVLDADRRVLENRDAEVQARTAAARAAVASFRALGCGWDPPTPMLAANAVDEP